MENTSGAFLVVGTVAGVAGFGVVTLFSWYFFCRKKLPRKGSLHGEVQEWEARTPTHSESLELTESQTGTETEIPVTSVQQSKSRHLSNDEAWQRAHRCFPNLLSEDLVFSWKGSRRLEAVLEELLRERIRILQEDEEDFERLLKRENAIELCIGLGLAEDIVVKRYEAVENIREALGIPCKTSTITTVRHLIRRLSTNNLFGDAEHIDGNIHDHYREKEWLSYLGVKVDRSNPDAALATIWERLDEKGLKDAYGHGTSGTSMEEIAEMEGYMAPSKNDRRLRAERQDFGDGVYCCKGNIQWPLSFGIDRCFPIWDNHTQCFRRSSQNPGLIIFPEAKSLNGRDAQFMYEVGKKQPYSDANLKNRLKAKEFIKFNDQRTQWKANNKNWKEFVKLARCFNLVMPGKQVFYGFFA